MGTDSIIKMVTFLFPHSARLQFTDYIHNKADRHIISKALLQNDFSIRNKFFADPLIKHLWTRFVSECPKIVDEHMRRIRKHPAQIELKYN